MSCLYRVYSVLNKYNKPTTLNLACTNSKQKQY